MTYYRVGKEHGKKDILSENLSSLRLIEILSRISKVNLVFLCLDIAFTAPGG